MKIYTPLPMKLKVISLLLCAFAVLFSACTVEKRIYRNGYYVGIKHRPSNNSTIFPKCSNTVERDSHARLNSAAEEDIHSAIDSINNSESQAIISIVEDKNIPLQEELVNPIRTSEKFSQEKISVPESKESVPPDEDSGNGLLRIIGWILIGLGALILWFASILIGILLMLLGLIFIIVGRKKGSEKLISNDKDSDAMVDVVYLKNGSIVRGTIIEQVPGVSLKIQTADGSVFFYKMEEIEKITKEKSTN